MKINCYYYNFYNEFQVVRYDVDNVEDIFTYILDTQDIKTVLFAVNESTHEVVWVEEENEDAKQLSEKYKLLQMFHHNNADTDLVKKELANKKSIYMLTE